MKIFKLKLLRNIYFRKIDNAILHNSDYVE